MFFKNPLAVVRAEPAHPEPESFSEFRRRNRQEAIDAANRTADWFGKLFGMDRIAVTLESYKTPVVNVVQVHPLGDYLLATLTLHSDVLQVLVSPADLANPEARTWMYETYQVTDADNGAPLETLPPGTVIAGSYFLSKVAAYHGVTCQPDQDSMNLNSNEMHTDDNVVRLRFPLGES